MATKTGEYNEATSLKNGSNSSLEASLRQMKFASSGYLDSPNGVTDSKFLSASHDHAMAMRLAGLPEQAGQMRKVFKDFRIAQKQKKRRIAECLAQTLLNMNPRRLSAWTIAAKAPLFVDGAIGGYALYEIGDNGCLADVSDVNLEGVQESARVEVGHEGTVDFDKWSDLDVESSLPGQLEDTFSGFLGLLQDASRAERSLSCLSASE